MLPRARDVTRYLSLIDGVRVCTLFTLLDFACIQALGEVCNIYYTTCTYHAESHLGYVVILKECIASVSHPPATDIKETHFDMSLEVEGTAIMPTPIPPWLEMGKALGLQEFFTILGSSKVLEVFLVVIVRIVGVLHSCYIFTIID